LKQRSFSQRQNHPFNSNKPVFLGLLLTVIGGGIDSGQALVMSLAKRWRWESIWLVWAIFGCVILPWAVVFAMLRDPTPVDVLHLIPASTVRNVMLFALGWGVGSILFGMGIVRVGMGLGLGISISLLAAVGTLLPLAVYSPQRLLSPAVYNIYLAVGVLIVGIVLCASAAHRRPEEKPILERERTSFAAGILCCVACGFLSPMFNLAVDAGLPISHAAEQLGAGAIGAGILPVALIMLSGFAINAGYCVYLLFRNQSWSDFRQPGTATYWFYGALMGALQMSAFLIYSIAASRLDHSLASSQSEGSVKLSVVLGWPVYTASMIVVGNVIGLLRGEWRGSDRLTFFLLGTGLAILVVATIIITRLGGKLS
jgi:L-rhamnose-H+ transport protein